MERSTVDMLRKLNTKFYETTGKEFDETRFYPWAGWEELYEKGVFNEKGLLNVLDLGCGNGRFAEFMKTKGVEYDYIGIDNDEGLLESAGSKLAEPNVNFLKGDILELDRLEQILPAMTTSRGFDLITLFGVMHHIPGNELRIALLKWCRSHLTQNGMIIFSVWDFINDERFEKRLLDPTELGIDISQLDVNDHILDWRKGEVAYRYCHHYPEDEINELLVNTGLKVIYDFKADGRSGMLNRYYVVGIG